MKKSLAALGLSLMVLSSAAFAVPSLQQVEQSIAQRNWQQADTQLSQVIDAHPNNAHARYLYAQVLDREGRASDALEQLQRAKSLDPQLVHRRIALRADGVAHPRRRRARERQRAVGHAGRDAAAARRRRAGRKHGRRPACGSASG